MAKRDYYEVLGVGKNATTIPPRFGDYSNSAQTLIPFFDGKSISICSCIFFKRIEFGTFKIRIMQTLPKTKEFDNITTAKPTMNSDTWVGTAVTSNVGKRNIFALEIIRINRYVYSVCVDCFLNCSCHYYLCLKCAIITNFKSPSRSFLFNSKKLRLLMLITKPFTSPHTHEQERCRRSRCCTCPRSGRQGSCSCLRKWR